MAMWIMIISGCRWLAPFPLPLAAPARVSLGEARPSSPSRAGSPIHGSGVEAAPYRGGATRLGWGRIGERGEEKVERGQKKRLVFVADGHACSRLLGSLRVPPLAIGVPLPTPSIL
jgi:hypothetical protein